MKDFTATNAEFESIDISEKFQVSESGAIGGVIPSGVNDIIKWDGSQWIAGINPGGNGGNGGNGGGGGGSGVADPFTTNLISGQSLQNISFNQTLDSAPSIATDLEIDGDGSIIPYTISGLSTTGYTAIFAEEIPNNNYKIHTVFGGGSSSGGSELSGEELRAINKTIVDSPVDVFVYDTSRDSDGGAWRKRTQHTSWYNEELNTATRGARREFPAVAVIVVEADKVTIYDGDDPDLSMWMVFSIWGLGGDPKTCCAALNGKVVVGSGWGVPQADFIKDTIDHQWNAVIRVPMGGGIINRNIDSRLGGDTSQLIVNNNVNDVAMTILPNALIDDATGLPVPTIAVATDGGVSVIKDDGTVVDIVSDNLNSEIPLEVNFRGRLLYSLLGSKESVSNLWSSVSTIYIPDDDVSTTYRHSGDYIAQYSRYNGLPLSEPHNSGHDMLVPINSQTYLPTAQRSRAINVLGTDHLYIGGEGSEDKAGGVAAISENLTNPKNGLIAHTTSRYNTGWMPGDIKLAALSDSVVESVGQPIVDVMPNGTFESNIDGWTSDPNSTHVTLSQATVSTTSTGSKAMLAQKIGDSYTYAARYSNLLTPGKRYRITGRVNADWTTAYKFRIRAGGSNVTWSTTNDLIRDDWVVFDTGWIVADGSHLEIGSESHGGGGIDNFFIDDVVVSLDSTEKIINGVFDQPQGFTNLGTWGWTAGTGATITVNNESLKLDTGSTGDSLWTYQTIPNLTAGDYMLVADITNNTTQRAIVRVGTTGANSLDLHNSAIISDPTLQYTASFTVAETGPVTVTFMYDTQGSTIYFDNVSVRPAEADRSVNGNGLQIVGEINKTPVAPGADLVAYSGFSANDYLMQPYNEDLDFGTGDFCMMAWIKDFAINDDFQRIFSRGIDGSTGFEWDLYFHISSPELKLRTYSNGVSNGDVYLDYITNMSVGSWNQIVLLRKSGMLSMYINGVKTGYGDQAFDYNMSNPGARLFIGNRFTPSDLSAFNGSIALARISATAPTAEQIAKIYRDEKLLFQQGAQSTLYGTSDAVTALSYDQKTELLHVGTASGRSDFSGLSRVHQTNSPVTTCIDAEDGLIAEN